MLRFYSHAGHLEVLRRALVFLLLYMEVRVLIPLPMMGQSLSLNQKNSLFSLLIQGYVSERCLSFLDFDLVRFGLR